MFLVPALLLLIWPFYSDYRRRKRNGDGTSGRLFTDNAVERTESSPKTHPGIP